MLPGTVSMDEECPASVVIDQLPEILKFKPVGAADNEMETPSCDF